MYSPIFDSDYPGLKSDDERSERNFNVKMMSGEERLVWLNYPRIAVTPREKLAAAQHELTMSWPSTETTNITLLYHQ